MIAPRTLGAGVRQVVGSSRPLSWVNTAYPFGAAYLLGGGGVDAVFWIGVVYFLVPYNLLMYGVNDVFDYESDLRNPRKGGVEGLVLTDRWHGPVLVTAALTNLPFIAVLVAAGTVRSTLVLAVVLLAVVAYSAPGLRFKERPLVDSLTSSSHFVGPALFGYVLVDGTFGTPALAVLAAFFCWGVASQAFGAVQDISADVGAGIASVATWLGAAATVRFAIAAYTVSGVVLLAATDSPGRLAGLLAVAYAANIAPYVSIADRDCETANAGWRRFLVLNYVTGFLVTQLLLWICLGR
jgi:lycopene elongase/hydratase (flavuxanthin-forming)